MSLLSRSTDLVTVFPEALVIDSDGNKITRPSIVGTLVRAVVQPLGAANGAPREDQNGGFNSESRFRLRLIGWQGAPLGAQGQIEWNGKRYSIEGDALVYNSSARTRHTTYIMIRS